MRYVGIDIGKKGGIATIEDGEFTVVDMPIYTIAGKGKSRKPMIDKPGLFQLLKSLKVDDMICYMERNRPYPGEGSMGAFSLGRQVGIIEGYLIALAIPHEIITPQKWYKHFGIVKKKGSKNASYEKAGSLFPTAELKTERGRIIDGRADALLICEYGRRVNSGTN